MNSKISVIVGGQFGSEGKGAIAAYLSGADRNPDRGLIAVRVAGPNAGHTVLGKCPPECTETTHTPDSMGWAARASGPDVRFGRPEPIGWGHPWRLRQVPVAAVTNPDAELVLAAGSEIDPTVLADELTELDAAGYRATERMMVDVSATVIEPSHLQAEQDLKLTERLGSTGKGIGAARMARLSRVARTWGDYRRTLVDSVETELSGVLARASAIDTARYLNSMLTSDLGNRPVHVLIEGTQGYGLGLHTRFYPTVTSSDCRAIDFLAMAGISPWTLPDRVDDNGDPIGSQGESTLDVWVVLRTYPIRVAGNSGPLAAETTWDQLGLPAEQTTVTKKTRRVGAWDPLLARQAVEANGGVAGPQRGGHRPPVQVALTMADHVVGGVAGVSNAGYDRIGPDDRLAMYDLLVSVAADCGVFPTLVGTGPDTVLDLRSSGQSGQPPVAGLNLSVANRAETSVPEPAKPLDDGAQEGVR